MYEKRETYAQETRNARHTEEREREREHETARLRSSAARQRPRELRALRLLPSSSSSYTHAHTHTWRYLQFQQDHKDYLSTCTCMLLHRLLLFMPNDYSIFTVTAGSIDREDATTTATTNSAQWQRTPPAVEIEHERNDFDRFDPTGVRARQSAVVGRRSDENQMTGIAHSMP